MKKTAIYSLIFYLVLFTYKAQSQVSVNVDLNRKTVYVQQPFHVTITVYTKTWFTAPLEFGNLQIPNAFIVPFDKTQPGIFTVGGKQLPGIQFYYIVFPYKAGEFTVPPLEITAQSPPEGSSQTRKIVLHTTPQSFVVKDVPAELKKKGAWFVAKDVTLHEKWEPDLKDLKTGDVIKRIITINAKGTLPQFIPDLNEQEILKWTSSYPEEPILKDTRGNGDANGESVQMITYLLEKAGNYTIPGVNLSFWNPYSAKVESRATQSISIQVKENTDLGILKTLKDSLDATVAIHPAETKAKTPFLIFGMKWYQFAGCLIICIVVLSLLIKLGRKLFIKFRTNRENYHNSEEYLFKKFQQANHDPKTFLNALYVWWDHFKGKSSASVGKTLSTENEQEESEIFKEYFDKALHNENPDNSEKIKQDLKKFRSKKKQKYSRNQINDWINSI